MNLPREQAAIAKKIRDYFRENAPRAISREIYRSALPGGSLSVLFFMGMLLFGAAAAGDFLLAVYWKDAVPLPRLGIPIFPLCLGLACTVGATRDHLRLRSLLRWGELTSGTIVESRRKFRLFPDTGESEDETDRFCLRVVIEFTTRRGESVRIKRNYHAGKGRLAARWADGKAGRRLVILYDPRHPGNASVVDLWRELHDFPATAPDES